MSSTINLLDEPLLTAGEIASLLGGSRQTVLQYARYGRLPCVIGKHVRFVRSDVDRALAEQRVRVRAR